LILFLAVSSPAAAATIQVTDDGRLVHFGELRPGADMRMTRAIRAFGQPDRRVPVGDGSEACHFLWDDRALLVIGSNFGGVPAGHSTCEADQSYVQVLRVRGKAASHGWRTDRGLRTGATKARMLRLYPRGHSTGRGEWSLIEREPGIGAGPTPILTARLRSGRVSSIAVWAGGAGD
jgi:hypothetical protein